MLRCIFLLLLTSLAAQAQNELDLENLFSNDKKLFRMAVDSSICIVRQDYVMKSSRGNEYGRAGKSYFGRRYTLGVVADHKIWALTSIATPWIGDKAFEQYKKNDTIRPHLASMALRPIFSTDYQPEEISPIETYDSSGIISYRTESPLSVGGFLNTQEGNGWLVVVSARDDLNVNEKSPLNVTVYTPNLNFQNTESETLLKRISLKDNVIGGIYFVATIKSGIIRYHAAGILKNKGNEWYVVRLPQTTRPQTPLTDELTPLKGKLPPAAPPKGTETSPPSPTNDISTDKEPVNKKRESKKKETKQNGTSTLPPNNY